MQKKIATRSYHHFTELEQRRHPPHTQRHAILRLRRGALQTGGEDDLQPAPQDAAQQHPSDPQRAGSRRWPQRLPGRPALQPTPRTALPRAVYRPDTSGDRTRLRLTSKYERIASPYILSQRISAEASERKGWARRIVFVSGEEVGGEETGIILTYSATFLLLCLVWLKKC